MDDLDTAQPPPKRVKYSSVDGTMSDDGFDVNVSADKTQLAKEAEVGITSYVNPSGSGFRGLLKKRYTDFLVNEILPNGQVLHLRDLRVSRPARGLAHVQEIQIEGAPGTGEESAVNLGGHDGSNNLDNARENLNQDSVQGNIVINAEQSNGSEISSNQRVSAEDKTRLIDYFTEPAVDELLELYDKILSSPETKPQDIGIVKTPFTSDRSVRSQIHQDIRRIFHLRIDSSTDKDGMLTLSAAPIYSRKPANQQTRKQWKQEKTNRADRGGDFLHFTLYKENKDTMEVISFLNRQLKTNAKVFQFAGTKDRRAVTVQRVSAHKIEAGRLAGMNRVLRNATVGDFEYQKHGLELGDLKGNEFVITLRDCDFELPESSFSERIRAAQSTVENTLRSLREHGFFNYYGLQRFGTFATRTDTVGIKLLQGNFKGACDDILEFNPAALAPLQGSETVEAVGADDRARAEAIQLFKTTGNVNEALDRLPRKFSAEANIIRHLGKHSTDYAGALMMIQRNMRLMYVHAYQSLVWNLAVGERWRLYSDKVVEGDLVLVNDHKDKVFDVHPVADSVDADGELVLEPATSDRAYTTDDVFERARPLTADEAASGQYTIFDVVLPLPGFDVLYPANAVADFYRTFMASARGGRLDPHDMRRRQKDFSLSGGYRKVLARIAPDYAVEVRAYQGEDEQFVTTDLDRIKAAAAAGRENEAAVQDGAGEGNTSSTNGTDKEPSGAGQEKEQKMAVVLTFQLSSSQYATMALRELSRGGVVPHKSDFGGGR